MFCVLVVLNKLEKFEKVLSRQDKSSAIAKEESLLFHPLIYEYIICDLDSTLNIYVHVSSLQRIKW